jgi:hypothetical protein
MASEKYVKKLSRPTKAVLRQVPRYQSVKMSLIHSSEKVDHSPTHSSVDRSHEVESGIPAENQELAIGIVGERRHEIDPAVEARVVRKIDLFLIPTMIFGYGLVYYDKVRVSYIFFPSKSIQVSSTKSSSLTNINHRQF